MICTLASCDSPGRAATWAGAGPRLSGRLEESRAALPSARSQKLEPMEGESVEQQEPPLSIWGSESTYNLNTALIQCIRQGVYWSRAMVDEEITFENMVDEIYMNVHHLEPFTSKNPHLVASTAFCCLYKLFTMRLTPR
eukprot:COSAG06_NODE_509_length_14898_cov_76.064869_11_plen_139_part_00